MTDDLAQRPIVIKRIKKATGSHHSGAWKIAYADFVTAMMAFFLLMWLLGSSTKAQLEGISDYFKTPLKIAMSGGSGSGDSSSVIKGSKYTKALYMDLMTLLYEVLGKIGKDGLMSIEADVDDPANSPTINRK